jgi:hypothetical protein
MMGGGVEPRGSTAGAQTAETVAAALAVLRDSISVDVHTLRAPCMLTGSVD